MALRLATCLAVVRALGVAGLALDDLATSGSVSRHHVGKAWTRALTRDFSTFRHRLRLCNAYPSQVGLDVYHGKEEKITGDVPMPYKACNDFLLSFSTGDTLRFYFGGERDGTFAISALPDSDAVLMLVVYRNSTKEPTLGFESHIFASLANAQVAVIDAYRGPASSSPLVRDAQVGPNMRAEKLHYNSVVALSEGSYKVALTDDEGKEKATASLTAANRESYVIIRTGLKATLGPSFPEELLVFPQSPSQRFARSKGAAGEKVGLTLLVSLLVAISVTSSVC